MRRLDSRERSAAGRLIRRARVSSRALPRRSRRTIVPSGSIKYTAGMVMTPKRSTRSAEELALWTWGQGMLRALVKSTTADLFSSRLTLMISKPASL